jgi:hypothetical protein
LREPVRSIPHPLRQFISLLLSQASLSR